MTGKQPDREEQRESLNTMRVAGGLLLAMALLLYFFHLAEAPMGHSTLGCWRRSLRWRAWRCCG